VTLVVGILAAAVLFALGALHVYWAGGGRWGSDVAVPTRDGRPSFDPGIASTLTVAALLCAAALVLLGRLRLWGDWLPRWPFAAGSWVLAIVFGGRVVGDFRWFGLFKRTTGTRFAWWDTRLYVPLCALLSIAALVVAATAP
jgi:Protein of unknown function (DUF3995)